WGPAAAELQPGCIRAVAEGRQSFKGPYGKECISPDGLSGLSRDSETTGPSNEAIGDTVPKRSQYVELSLRHCRYHGDFPSGPRSQPGISARPGPFRLLPAISSR